jgi:uncharacterized protein involved in type VI secretion and phage assembly
VNPGVELRINGQALQPEELEGIRIEQSLMLPDAFSADLAADWRLMSKAEELLGAEIEILLASPDGNTLKSIVQGQVLALEPRFGDLSAPGHGGANGGGGATHLAFAGYDHSHKLNRTRRTATFQNMTVGDVAHKVASTAKFEVGTIESTGSPRKFWQQNNETDWDFLWRLAKDIDFEVVVIDKKLHFRKAGGASTTPHQLDFGEELMVFNPRITAVQQLDEFVVRGWDPEQQQTVEGRARVTSTDSKPGISRDKAASAGSGGTLTVSDRPVTSKDEAQALAESLAAQHGNAYITAEGICRGDPALHPGSKIEVRHLAKEFDGVYTLSQTKHVLKGGRGYETHFTISGRTPRRLVDLTTPAKRKSWGNSVVVGKVTQNKDPDKRGRVRVTYPALSGDNEGWWARVVAPSAGKDRGLMMLPQVGDEVLIAFEHDDVHFPYVIGSLWNGKGTPGDLAQHDGSFVLQSDKFMNVKSKDSISIKSDKDLTIEIGGAISEKSKQDIKLETSDGSISGKASKDFTVETSSGEVKIKGGTSVKLESGGSLEIKANGMLKIEASGTVQISGAQIMLG